MIKSSTKCPSCGSKMRRVKTARTPTGKRRSYKCLNKACAKTYHSLEAWEVELPHKLVNRLRSGETLS
ncbi:MAG: hypothetical protein DMF68_01590 [Acidobacteria bacterium]|nr:MAG: hypothetical protein DMF68_01590 [Acidobacteriota bacterium]